MTSKNKISKNNKKKNYDPDVFPKYGFYWFSRVSQGIPTHYGNVQT
jgi:hypothetical protein